MSRLLLNRRAFLALCLAAAGSGFLCPGAARALETMLPTGDGLVNYLYTPTEMPDPTKSYLLVVGVHGAGGTGKGAAGLESWATEFDDVLVLGPTFAQPRRDPSAPRSAGMPRESFQMSGAVHEAKLAALIAEIGKTWKLRPKIMLHGFSAGAQFAHRYAFHHPELIAAVSAHSGGSWATLASEDRINSAAKQIPFAVSCGEEDRGVSGPTGTLPRLEGARRFAAAIASLGFTVDFQTFPGVGHEQSVGAKAMARRLLERLRTQPPAAEVK